MSLFIACLAIYGLHLSAWLYPAAVVLWVVDEYIRAHLHPVYQTFVDGGRVKP